MVIQKRCICRHHDDDVECDDNLTHLVDLKAQVFIHRKAFRKKSSIFNFEITNFYEILSKNS